MLHYGLFECIGLSQQRASLRIDSVRPGEVCETYLRQARRLSKNILATSVQDFADGFQSDLLATVGNRCSTFLGDGYDCQAT